MLQIAVDEGALSYLESDTVSSVFYFLLLGLLLTGNINFYIRVGWDMETP